MLARVTQVEQLAAQAASWQAAARPDMAAQLYQAALDQDPSKYALRMQLAECLVQLGQPEPAAEQYLMVAQAYAARGHHQECLAICERVLTVAPQSFVYMTVGPMIRRIGRHARDLCAKAAGLHLSSGRQTDGLQILRLGAELDPHNPEVRRQLARIYQARHMTREAVEALRDAGNLLTQAKRYGEYIEVGHAILAMQPNDLDTLRELPRAYLELRRPNDAVRALGALTKASPGDIAGYEILAQAFAVIGRTEKSLLVLERLVEQLGSTGQRDQADAILNHAKYWRPTDIAFLGALKKLHIPPPAPPAPAPKSPAAPAPAPAPEGTVVLSIADLVIDESAVSPVPREDSQVHLVEAEGTVMLNLEDLVIDAEEPAPAPAPPTPPSDTGGDQATVSLDGSALRAALMPSAAAAPAPNLAADRPTRRNMKAIGPDLPSGDALTNPTRSMSDLIYDDEDDDPEPATELHLKPLTAEDIARAQREQADEQEAAKTPPMGGPTAPPPLAAPPPGEDAPTMANLRPVTAADIARALANHEQAQGPDDQPTLPPPQPPRSEDEDELTMVRMDALTPEDIARALAEQRGKDDD